VQAMQPIRITTKGANVALPLRMVAAGTGATTTVTLFVLSEFRAETANFPTFTIAPESDLWDYSVGRSNYTDLRDEQYKSSKGFAWLSEAALNYSVLGFKSRLMNSVNFGDPAQSGYGSEKQTPQAAAEEDMKVLFAGINDHDAWVTRLRADLSREALGTDLVLQASKSQTEIQRFIQTTKSVGPVPACPPPPPGCEEPGKEGDDYWTRVVKGNRSADCAMGQNGLSESVIAFAVLALGAGLYRRRRR
jgi:MYXO-CTERM domain-containing protein